MNETIDDKTSNDKKIIFPDLYMSILEFSREFNLVHQGWFRYSDMLISEYVPRKQQLEYIDNLINTQTKFSKEYLPKLEAQASTEIKKRGYRNYISSLQRDISDYWLKKVIREDQTTTFNENVLNITNKLSKKIDEYKSSAHPEAVNDNKECILKVETILKNINDQLKGNYEKIEITEKNI